MRATLEARLKDIEANNAAKLEEMRRTVDEKLHATLEQRLGESFKLVSDRLEQVHRGLGEMQTLAAGVGDLKKVLTNVKTRGTWGEVQLESLLEQLLTPDQYAKNVATIPKSNDRVEFAIKLPGRHDAPGQSGANAVATPVWLPIDAKFPREDYERLIDAQDRADVVAVEEASRALEGRIRAEAKAIAQKYVAPPHTTDFALLFLPTEGLYAEILRRPGLTDFLQREYRVSVTGPTTLTALLNSLQMGFRTLAIEQRSSEVWQVLGAVKTEFRKFGEVLSKTRSQLEAVTRSIESAETRTRQMSKKLRDVEALPGEQVANLLGDEREELSGTRRTRRLDRLIRSRRSQRSQCVAGDAHDAPVGQHGCAHLLVEADGVLIPVEHGPFEAAALAFHRKRRQGTQHLGAESAAANGRLHVQVFQIQPALAEKG